MTAPQRRSDLAALGFGFVGLGLSWWNRFVQDDAFIAFRYARNVVEGHGLVFNPGERVEGYTDFLWVLLHAIPIASGVDAARFSIAIGLLCFVGTLAFTHALTRRIAPAWGWMPVALLATNYTFTAYATGGLETQLQALLVTAGAWCCERARHEQRGFVALSVLAAAAFLTRMDSALPFAWLVLAAGWRAPRRSRALLVLPGLFIALAWLGWKWSYYGQILPNTFAAKAQGGSLVRGASYVGLFFTAYMLWPHVALILARARERRVWLAILTSWLAYVALVGGDFMELRFIVPVMPLLFVCVACALRKLESRALAGALVALPILFSAIHAHSFVGTSDVESVDSLRDHVESEGWRAMGVRLREILGRANATIATTAAGAIPYESRLKTVDMLGLTDPWVAHHGRTFSETPGHFRVAPLRYLVERRVDLVLGHPADRRPFDRAQLRSLLLDPAADSSLLPEDARVVHIPVGSRHLTALYLRRTRLVDEALARAGIDLEALP